MFIPKRHKEWKPEHMKGKPRRHCHWCVSGPHDLDQLLQVLELPMRYHFCSTACCGAWQLQRHDEETAAWLKQGAGTRKKNLKRKERDD